MSTDVSESEPWLPFARRSDLSAIVPCRPHPFPRLDTWPASPCQGCPHLAVSHDDAGRCAECLLLREIETGAVAAGDRVTEREQALLATLAAIADLLRRCDRDDTRAERRS